MGLHENWAGRVALVTGASSGIGQAVAGALAGNGMKVVGCARRIEPLTALKGTIDKAANGEFLPLVVDLRDEGQILGMFQKIRDTWGGVDVLVNNAGLGHTANLTDGETEKWREMLDINVLALCICTREAVRDMRRADDGYVIHISSMAGHRVVPNAAMYCATKFAVRALTEGLRQELRALTSRIRVTAISPGFVETGFHSILFQSAEKARELYSSLETLQPADIADLVVYALSTPPHVQLHDVLLRPRQQAT